MTIATPPTVVKNPLPSAKPVQVMSSAKPVELTTCTAKQPAAPIVAPAVEEPTLPLPPTPYTFNPKP